MNIEQVWNIARSSTYRRSALASPRFAPTYYVPRAASGFSAKQIPVFHGPRFRRNAIHETRLWPSRPSAHGTAEVTKALPFTEASLARAIKGVGRAGLFVLGVRPDGTLIVGDKPLETASLVPITSQDGPVTVRRFGEKLNGGQGAA
ncbi:hypothetical protein ABID62_001495 [Bradyrhizobium sp. S3.9.1]